MRREFWILASGLGLLISGCSLPLPQAQSDPTKFYVLSAPTAAVTAAAPSGVALPVLRMRPVEIASYLKARPMVVRRGANELEFRDYARWGEPLEQGVARVLGDELVARGVVSAVRTGGLKTGEGGDVRYELVVRVLACEGVADGTVNFHAVFELTKMGDDPGAPWRGEYRASGLKWTPSHNASLAAALSQAVAGLAGDVAAKIR